ncbi:MFS transporter [Janthinobacterium sp. GW458P]|uniref:MFS transporter n=1 Tax=Janthinobacterium sp. GW458P TaxID=1981504 RepID=UPI000A3222DE|nr:MFS transporter [Janthinobacterium sp. GW458P]MBE3025132.1 MFS transporter [Janthinobacterium sp. GW458P]
MNNTNATSAQSADRLPFVALLALAMTGFLALLTETIPAGMLTQLSEGMGVSQALAGQFVTLYAIGSLVAAIPLTAATLAWRRRPLMIAALFAMLLFNMVTALTSNYVVALSARFLAGMAGGLIWGMLAGYARRLVPDHLKGRALAVAGIGAPLALSLGVPLGTLLGATLGWRTTFGVMSLLTLGVMAWISLQVPDYPGQAAKKQTPVYQVFNTPGVRPVLAVLAFWILAHSILYTYLMPFLEPAGLSNRVDVVLLLFGVASLAGIWISAMLIDRMLRSLVLLSLAGFALASLALGLAGTQPWVIYIAVIAWGLTFGGSAALLQTASAEAAGSGADVAQSILVTVWNIAIAAGGLIGGILLETSGVGIFPWVLFILLLMAFLITWACRTHGFPGRAGRIS